MSSDNLSYSLFPNTILTQFTLSFIIFGKKTHTSADSCLSIIIVAMLFSGLRCAVKQNECHKMCSSVNYEKFF